MGTAVAITWKKCRDGAELLNYGGDWTALEKELMSEGELLMAIMGAPPPPHGEATKQGAGRWIRLRSARLDPVPLRMVDLSNSVVLDFITAHGFDGIVSFVEKYGLPDYCRMPGQRRGRRNRTWRPS